jgi:hypothetical protein
VCCKWNCNGSVLGVAGFKLGGSVQEGQTREMWMVQVCCHIGI